VWTGAESPRNSRPRGTAEDPEVSPPELTVCMGPQHRSVRYCARTWIARQKNDSFKSIEDLGEAGGRDIAKRIGVLRY
jgi:hypothetical protein